MPKKQPKIHDVLENEKLEQILGGFVEFRHELNNINALLQHGWHRSIAHYTICIGCLHSRINRKSVRPKAEAILLMQGRMSSSQINKVVQELVSDGYLAEKPLATDKRKKGYWATDKLVHETFLYLLVAWEVNYHNDDVMTYFRGLTEDMRYLMETEEGSKIRAAYQIGAENQ